MAHETTTTASRARAAFQNRFLAQDIVHDREMASPREREGRGTLYIYRVTYLVCNLIGLTVRCLEFSVPTYNFTKYMYSGENSGIFVDNGYREETTICCLFSSAPAMSSFNSRVMAALTTLDMTNG